ncbi:hypothetical protein B0H11DRAFT_471985 [Mycena galericulata]|nr:hypothetical protein B0H11DRAFT_471985 [Mycena galericulata]
MSIGSTVPKSAVRTTSDVVPAPTFRYPWFNNTPFRNTPMEVVCSILKMAAVEDRTTALVILRVSKAIHNFILPIVYNDVHLASQDAARNFALIPERESVKGCVRPWVRYLNTMNGALGPFWLHLAHRRPEIEHLCVSMMDLYAMSTVPTHLQPSHLGVVVDGIHLFPDYRHPPPDRLPRCTAHYPYSRALGGPRTVQAHASVFMWASHIYFVDNMPPNIGCLRPYLLRVTHFAFVYRRDYGLQFPELSAVLRAVLDIPSITLVLVVRKSRTEWSTEEKDRLRERVPESVSPRVVFFDDLQGLTWDEDEDAIWRMAEEKRPAATPPGLC